MIKTTVVGSWPPADQFREQLASYFKGELTQKEAETLLQSAAAVAIEQQQQCGVTEFTGGEISADYFILHFPKYFSGVEPTHNTSAWDGRGEYRIVGELDAPNGLGIADAFSREKQIDPRLSKVTIPGASELLMMISPAESQLAARPIIVQLIRTEIAACIDAGAKDVQLDLPHIAMGLADGWWQGDSVALVREIFRGFNQVRRSVHFCYGDFQATTWVENRAFRPLLPIIQALDGVVDRVVLEFSLAEQWAERALLADIPSSMEVAVGIIDVKSPEVETVKAVEEKVVELLRYVSAERLLICPSCGLGRRNVPLAQAKVSTMTKAVERVNKSRAL